MEKGYHKGQDLTMSELGLSLEELAGQPLEVFAREGAKLLLMVGLEEEVTAALMRRPYERSQGKVVGYRNGHRNRQVSCGAGVIEVPVPRVSDTEETFRSQLLEAWQRRSKLLEETIPLLYVEGLSTRDFKRALKPLWGKSGLSRSSVSRANKALKEAFNNWRRRDLSLEDIIYLFLDGIYLGVRGNSRNKEAVLVAHGITREGERVVLHLSLGGRESTESWKGVLNDLIERGLGRPQLLITDGNPGLLKAIKDVWPEVPRQRCAVHRIRKRRSRTRSGKQYIASSTLPVLTTPAMKPGSFCLAIAGSSPPLARSWPNTSRNASPSIAFPSVTGNTSAPQMSLSGPLRRSREGPG